MDDGGGGGEGFVLYLLRGGFCGEGFGLGVIVGGFLEPAVVLRPAVISYFGGDFGLGNVEMGGLPKFSIQSFSPVLASSSSSFSKIGARVVPVIFAWASSMHLISACVSLYHASTITLISSMWELC
ncbi:hypothetical protein Hanom_Chr17g01574811 [Helianthus anomalus]